MSETSTSVFGSPAQDTTPADWEQLDTPTAAPEGRVLEDSMKETPTVASGDAEGSDPAEQPDQSTVPDESTQASESGRERADTQRTPGRVRPRAESSDSPDSEKSGDSGRLPVSERQIMVAKRQTPRKSEGTSAAGVAAAEPEGDTQGTSVRELYPALNPEAEDVHRIEVQHPQDDHRRVIDEELERLRGPAERLRWLLHSWRKTVGMAALAPLPAMGAPGDPVTRPGVQQVKPSLLRRAVPAVWLVLFTVLALVGLGLMWVRCQRIYLGRLDPHNHHHNSTMDYVCLRPFVWTCLLPRLIYLLGYLAVFVCWHCLRHPDLGRVISEVYDTVTDQQEYDAVSNKFRSYCRWDAWLLVGLYLTANLSAVVESMVTNATFSHKLLYGEGSAAMVIFTASVVVDTTFRAVLDVVTVIVLVSYSLSLKYLSLLLLKVQTHLGNLSEQAHVSSDCYTRRQYTRGHDLMQGFQASVSASLLLVLLRVSQGVVRIVLDLTGRHWHLQSLACLPSILIQALAAIHYIYKCCCLSDEGRLHHHRHVSTGPDFATGGTPETEDVTDDDTAPLAGRAGTTSEAGGRVERTRQEWDVALQRCPMVDGRMFGLTAARWMPVLMFVVLAAYCVGLFLLERFWPLF